ncbi:4-hydroxy-tetrahydrodipicolinate synthase [Luteimonas yindakuii]|uniref:4-hydroxy-tetrahydrodipicolinate synthase n=1 Tax=Luteimonas yindakuii TaxID=2565782 RepID=A0A4Z1R2C2_9GAMM|nr:4-hydroxy-tetrahydrodipicolinate synthase [Luteimonas yindakuii]TKS53672.1 4-hydroxy-tetrahydrodipicolinate synthase [Luteimonas yindakuii]
MRLSGSITALATPFTATGELDLDAWNRLLAQQLDGGTRGLVVAGSTGEAAALYHPEFDLLVRTAVQVVAGRVPVIVGTGNSATARTIEQTRRAADLGADAALVVTPPYVRPTQAGLLAHYRAVADDGALPVLLYNVPPRTGCDLLPETVAALAGHPAILGIKEARSEPDRMQALLALRGEEFVVLSGDDPTAARAMLAGADGVISVVSNIVPATFRRLCDLATGGDQVQAQALDEQLQALYDFAGIEPNPIPVKAVLARMGIGHGLRLPLTTLSPTHAAAADRALELAQALERSSRDTLAS